MAPSSVANYLSALWVSARSQGFPSHALDHRLHQTLRGIKRLGHSTRKDRHPLSRQEMASIFMEINTLLPWDLAFWAAVTLAFRALLRKSHYTYSRHTLRWGDVSLYPDHIVIRVRSSKTDQFSTREHRIVLNSSPGSNLCPVHWITALARVQNPLESDYLIRVPGNLGLGPLSYPWFNQKLKDLSASLGLDPTTISSHLLRHGGTSFMSAQGCDLLDIRARGGWSSSSIFRYLHPADDTLLEQDLLVSSYI